VRVLESQKLRAMGGDKRSVDRTPRDFLAAWGRGDAGLVPCGACDALVHSKYLHPSVRHIALIVGTWSRSSSSGSTGEQR
jgi:hypothetical protein